MNIEFSPKGRVAWSLALFGLLGLLLCFYLGRAEPMQVWGGYLVAFLFWLGLSLGAMALTMIHMLAGGAWGYYLQAQLRAALHTLPLMMVAFIPLLFGASELFPWMSAADSRQFSHQAWYLNEAFWLGRNLFFAAIWLVLMLALLRYRQWIPDAVDPAAETATPSRGNGYPLAVSGAILYLVSIFLFSVDWIMALDPRWFSSVFGLTLALTQLLGALAWLICVFALAQTNLAHQSREHLGDMGSLLMVMLLGFGYLVFMDYLTAWSGDLPGETAWYIPRTLTSWKWLAGAGIVIGLMAPFACLLSRRIKRMPAGLGSTAILLLLGNALFMAWLVFPTLRSQGLRFLLSDLLAFVGLGAVWLSVFSSALELEPLQGNAHLTQGGRLPP